jgi:photoactive yellow protein
MVELMKFGSADVQKELSTEDIDNLAFGAVLVDGTGRIIKYNKAEGEIVGRDPATVIGKNFFTEVAPCTNSPQFFGKFKEGVNTGRLNVVFDYVFNYKMKPTTVKVHMMKELAGDHFWIFVKRA